MSISQMKNPAELPVTVPPEKPSLKPEVKADSINGASVLPDPVIEQAQQDLDAGLVDTDMRATAGLDAKRRARLVPGAAGQPVKVDP
jgi:hypothetical protein